MVDFLNSYSGYFNPYRVLNNEEKTFQAKSYLESLVKKNGPIDTKTETLLDREIIHQKFLNYSKRWTGSDISKDEFMRCMATGPTKDTDPRLLWLLIAAKCNRGERYGVEIKLEEYRKNNYKSVDRTELYLLLEERYHTKILMGTCELCNIDFELPDPPFLQKIIIDNILLFPKSLANLLVFAGEIAGIHIFQLLEEKIGLFAEDREIESQLRILITQILSDEIGHVVSCRIPMNSFSMAIAKRLVPLYARSLLSDIPELGLLAGSAEAFMKNIESPIKLPSLLSWANEFGDEVEHAA